MISLADCLSNLGFSIRSTADVTGYRNTLAESGISIPEDYLLFLNYDLNINQVFGFKFVLQFDGTHFEGQVDEFADYSAKAADLISAIIVVGGCKMLPIAFDAGGNSIILKLDTTQNAVYDMNYATGLLNIVAESFYHFILSLYILPS